MLFIEKFFPKNFNRIDVLGVIASVVFSLISLLYLFSIKPPSSVNNHPAIARIKEYQIGVKHRIAGTVSFIDIESRGDLQNSDEIYTGGQSKARIEFLKSKNEVIVPSGSLVRIEDTPEGEILEIKEGVAEIIVKKGEEAKLVFNGQTIKLTSTNDKIGIVRAYKIKNQLVFNNVESPKEVGVEIKTAPMKIEYIAEKIEAPKIEAIIEAPEATPIVVPPPAPPIIPEVTKKEIIPLKILAPLDNQKIEIFDTIDLKWSGSQLTKISFAKDPDELFGNNAQTMTGNSGVISPKIYDGELYIGFESETHEKRIVPITLFSKFKITNISPKDNETITLQPGNSLKLSWDKLPVKNYVLTIKDSKGREETYTLLNNEYTIQEVKGSTIEWSVTPVIEGAKKVKASKALINLVFDGDINFNGSLQNRKIFNLSELNIQLEWNTNSIQKSKFILEDLTEEDKLVDKVIDGNSYLFNPKKVGLYQVKVSSIDYPTLKSAQAQFEVRSISANWKENQIALYEGYEPEDNVTLEFKLNAKHSEDFLAQIDLTTSKGIETFKSEIDSKKVKLKLQKFGQYCVKIIPNQKTKYYDNSAPFCFKFNEIEPFKEMPILNNTILTFTKSNGVDAFKTEIAPVNRASKYHFEIYKDSEGKELIYKQDSNKPQLTWITKKSGIFYFRYKVSDVKNRESHFSPLSKLIFPISPFHKWDGDKK
jgi:hypothetical protein